MDTVRCLWHEQLSVSRIPGCMLGMQLAQLACMPETQCLLHLGFLHMVGLMQAVHKSVALIALYLSLCHVLCIVAMLLRNTNTLCGAACMCLSLLPPPQAYNNTALHLQPTCNPAIPCSPWSCMCWRMAAGPS